MERTANTKTWNAHISTHLRHRVLIQLTWDQIVSWRNKSRQHTVADMYNCVSTSTYTLALHRLSPPKSTVIHEFPLTWAGTASRKVAPHLLDTPREFHPDGRVLGFHTLPELQALDLNVRQAVS
jgi:hypothetical protein